MFQMEQFLTTMFCKKTQKYWRTLILYFVCMMLTNAYFSYMKDEHKISVHKASRGKLVTQSAV